MTLKNPGNKYLLNDDDKLILLSYATVNCNWNIMHSLTIIGVLASA